MSSIIKGGRIRKQTIIDLSDRMSIESVEYDKNPEYNEAIEENNTNLVLDEAKIAQMEQEHMNFVYKKSESILEEARQKADEILNAARKEAELLKDTAKEETAALIQETKKQQEVLMEQTKGEAEVLRQEGFAKKQEIIEAAEGELTETLKSLLQYLISEELYQSTEWLRCVVKKMLSNDALKNDIRVLVSRGIYNKLSDEEIKAITSIKEDVTLQMSEAASDTMCKVESKEGAIEYDVSQGLERVITDINILQNLNQENL